MNLKLSPAPHVLKADNTRRLMLDVIIALVPASLAGVYFFGLKALLLLVLSMASAVLSEYVWQKLMKLPVRVGDLSALVTGLLLGLNLPAGAPWWLAVLGSAVAIIVVKQLFGGIGDNFVNPALAARAILLASWPVHLTRFTLPTAFSGVDAVSSPTVLAGFDASSLDLFLGNAPGCIGEVSKVAILIGLAYLIIRGTISFHIPVIFLGVTALLAWIMGPQGAFTFDGDPLRAILSGGVMFGAVFMATDYATCPMTTKGQAVFAIGCGVIVSLIRAYGSYPEGVTYAILIMNIVTPLIDKYMRPRVYGSPAKEAKA
ncbi:MAG TPA: RnfABCDGE type electron transport complex subunit D [Feifaniaceae bacterium]|nr:RnfABCDGE type electron transport complex subunit D [Feifaniaceae bacterium]